LPAKKRTPADEKRTLSPMEKFLSAVESAAITVATRDGIAVRVERDTRGRYPTFTLRALGDASKFDKIVKERYVDGLKVKAH
jgi:hypothetical protein